MKMCGLCSKLNIDLLSKAPHGRSLHHQPSFTALKTSASTGCEMCSMFLNGVTEVYCREKEISAIDAHRIFQAIDSRGKAPCLVESVTWNCGGMGRLLYGIPYLFPDGPKYQISGYCATACFQLRNLLGLGDERIRQTELTRMLDWGIAGRWLRDCTTRHQTCFSVMSQRPTRLLDLGAGGRIEPRLIAADGGTAEYATLSHCWGKTRPLTTKSSNLQQHLELIPLSSMPRTFQDAVVATRLLGIRHLWIDSLCIIQDSAEDWRMECLKMADIYQGSVVTICGPSTPDSTSGFLAPRVCPEPDPYLWKYRNANDTRPKRATIRLCPKQSYMAHSRDYPERPWLTDEEKVSPLRSRGWILQEYMLSTRILFFGLYRMYWECNACVRFEDFASLQESRKEGLHCAISNLKAGAAGSSSSVNFLSEVWYPIIKEYTRRSLTEQKDKLPGLSGIAARLLCSASKDEYHAGLFKQSIHEGLTWIIDPKTQTTLPQPAAYRAPSWSWASTNYAVEFTASRPGFWGRVIGIRSRRGPDMTMKICDIYTRTHGGNRFGEVAIGAMKITGKVAVGTVRNGPPCKGILDNGQIPPNRLTLIVFDPVTRKPAATRKYAATFYPDDPGGWGLLPCSEGPQKSPRKIECLCIDTWGRDDLTALAIEPLPPNDMPPGAEQPIASDGAFKAYRRIGFVEHTNWKDSRWFEDSPWEKIELF